MLSFFLLSSCPLLAAEILSWCAALGEQTGVGGWLRGGMAFVSVDGNKRQALCRLSYIYTVGTCVRWLRESSRKKALAWKTRCCWTERSWVSLLIDAKEVYKLC